MLKLYNTLFRKKEIFKPLRDKKVGFYLCGPTVYGPGHIGHARTYIAFDVIRRYLEHKGYKVKYVMNITDVHDDIINAAIKEKIDIFTLGNKYTKLFLEEQEKLGIKKANAYPRVTEHIKEIIKFIQELEKKGFAYEKDDSVYFDVSKFKDYGKLSRIKLEKAKTGTRVQTDKYERKDACDFVLWKKAKPGEPSWMSPWGSAGRPGWHIECSVMSKKHLGEQIDIHGGARDLIFPHHENEIAQSEAITGKIPFVKYWLHAGLLTINGQKMSKSLGNYIEIGDMLEKSSARVIRMFVASSHYQSDLDWSEKNLLQAKEGLARIEEFIEKLKMQNVHPPKAGKKRKTTAQSKKLISQTEKQFEEAMDDDFNTPEALARIFDLIRRANPLLDKNQIDKKQAKEILDFFKKIDKIFNFIFPEKKEKIPQTIKDLAKKREKLRKQKKWAQADKIRKEIARLGFEIKDTATGATIKKK
jgi:cysteinyl-tRNA synthetase